MTEMWLGALTKQKRRCADCFARLLAGLDSEWTSAQAKALWMIGEAGYAFPNLMNENIASSAPALFAARMDRFLPPLSGECEHARIEAPEIFRVMGRRLPDAVLPYRERLAALSETDENRIVRIHAQSAIKAMDKARKEGSSCRK